MDNVKLFVAVPAYGGIPIEFAQSLMHLQANPPCDIFIKPLPGDSLVSRARNSLTAMFLKTDCTHLLFIDSDLIFSSEHIKTLLDCDEQVIGGMYPKKKQGKIEWVCNGFADQPKPDETGKQEVRYIGTGFLMVKREVFEKMIAAYGDTIAFHPDHATDETWHDLWPVGVYNKRHLSEDWFFCQRWLDLGGKVYGHTRVILKHVGHAIYPLQSQVAELLPKDVSIQ